MENAAVLFHSISQQRCLFAFQVFPASLGIFLFNKSMSKGCLVPVHHSPQPVQRFIHLCQWTAPTELFASSVSYFELNPGSDPTGVKISINGSFCVLIVLYNSSFLLWNRYFVTLTKSYKPQTCWTGKTKMLQRHWLTTWSIPGSSILYACLLSHLQYWNTARCPTPTVWKTFGIGCPTSRRFRNLSHELNADL